MSLLTKQAKAKAVAMRQHRISCTHLTQRKWHQHTSFTVLVSSK